MNNIELSNQFDTLVSSYRRFKDFDDKEPMDTLEFDEYEKSLYLTKAQEELVLSLYNGKNPYGDSFESTEELRRHLAPLVKEAKLSPIDAETGLNGFQPAFNDTTGITDMDPVDGATIVPNGDTGITSINFKPKSDLKYLGIDKNSKFFELPKDLWFITYESVIISDAKCENKTSLEVFPVRQDEYHRIKKNPFRGTNSRRALRLDLANNLIEIVSKHAVTDYYVRYFKKLMPIVLENMPNGVTVSGIAEKTECELHEVLHQRLLELAVTMALQSKGYRINNENK